MFGNKLVNVIEVGFNQKNTLIKKSITIKQSFGNYSNQKGVCKFGRLTKNKERYRIKNERINSKVKRLNSKVKWINYKIKLRNYNLK